VLVCGEAVFGPVSYSSGVFDVGLTGHVGLTVDAWGLASFCCVPAGTKRWVTGPCGPCGMSMAATKPFCASATTDTVYGLCSIRKRASCAQSLYLGAVELHKGMSHIGLQAGAAPAIHSTVG